MKSAVSASSVSRAFTDGLNLKDNFEEGGFFYAQKLLWFWMNVDQQARARCLFVSFLWLRADGIIICAIVSSASRCAFAPKPNAPAAGRTLTVPGDLVLHVVVSSLPAGDTKLHIKSQVM